MTVELVGECKVAPVKMWVTPLARRLTRQSLCIPSAQDHVEQVASRLTAS